jgi:RNA polymerase sigma factor (sigma-70 family)
MPFETLDLQAGPHWTNFRDDPMNWAARNALLMVYMPLAKRAARSEAFAGGSYYFRGEELDDDDLHQLAFFALLDLLSDWKPERNPSFTLYASALLRLRIKAAVRSLGWVSRHGRRLGYTDNRVSGDAPTADGQDLWDDLPTHLDGPELCAELADFREKMLELLRDDRDRTIFKLRFLCGMTNEAVGRQLDLDSSTISLAVSQRIAPAIARLSDEPAAAKDRLRTLAREGNGGARHAA